MLVLFCQFIIAMAARALGFTALAQSTPGLKLPPFRIVQAATPVRLAPPISPVLQLSLLPRLAPLPVLRRAGLFLFAVGIELLKKGQKVGALLFVLEGGIDHLRARNFPARVLDVFAKGRFIAGQAEILVRVRVGLADHVIYTGAFNLCVAGALSR